MATTSNLLQFCLPKNPCYPSFLPSRLSSLSLSSRNLSFSICSSSIQPSLGLAAIADPSLHHANVLFFKSGYNVQIVVEDDEPEDVLVRRFRREVSKAGVIQECRRRRYFENTQEKKKRKAQEAGRRNRRRRFGPKFTASPSSADDNTAKNAREDSDDNWDLPEGDLPY